MIIDWAHMIVLALAVARVTRMFVQEHGPGNIFGAVRWMSGADVRPLKPGSFAEVWNCPWCISFWWALVAFGAYVANPYVTILVCLPLAISMVAGGAIKLTNR